jgi:hypothetical protein
MKIPVFSKKGKNLIKLYKQMVENGYERTNHTIVKKAFSYFELTAYREPILSIFHDHTINTVLDYGCGASDWQADDFDKETGQSAIKYFHLQHAFRYDPARNLDERQKVDCVLSFDVLEHIFISDIPAVLRDMFSYAKEIIILNVACYPAAAKLPNGENAHVTIRPPEWWKGMLDSISVEYPKVLVYLMCSTEWRKSLAFLPWSGNQWLKSSSFVINE